MRLDFNQHGSWRKGPDFDERDPGWDWRRSGPRETT